MAQRDESTGKLFEHITIPTTRTVTICRTPDEGRRDVSSAGWSFARKLSFMAGSSASLQRHQRTVLSVGVETAGKPAGRAAASVPALLGGLLDLALLQLRHEPELPRG